MAKRLVVSLVSLALLLLLAEGTLSLFFGRSLRGLVGGGRGPLEALLDQRMAEMEFVRSEAAHQPGPYRRHPDPYIGYTFKTHAEVELAGVTFETDDLGMRVRPGPPVAPDAFRVLFLGDSVAFGKGLESDRVIAARVEELLRGVRPADARQIACFTIAVPSWNYRNAARFVLDHLDRLKPDLVLYMHVPNDVSDSYGADELGRRTEIEDPGSLDPLIPFMGTSPRYFVLGMGRHHATGHIDERMIGPFPLFAGLSHSAEWRLDDMARTLRSLSELLEEAGVRLVLLPYEEHAVHRQLMARMVRAGFELPVIPLLDHMTAADGQEDDPHPSAATTEAFAIWTAQALLERKLVPGEAVRPLPAVAPGYAGRRGVELNAEEVVRWNDDYEQEVADELQPEMVEETLRGMRQVYGGMNVDGTLAMGLLALLPPGRELVVELEGIRERPDLAPNEVVVSVDGERLGELEVTGARAKGTFALPAAASEHPYEVRLTPTRWGVMEVDGRQAVVSVRFVALRSRP